MAKVTALKIATISTVADQLGDVRAQIKRLKDEAKALEKIIVNDGAKVLEGRSFVATVVKSVRKITDWKKIAIDLGATKLRITKNTREFDVVGVKMTAHKK